MKKRSNLDGQSAAITKNTSEFNHHLHPTHGIFNFDINQMFPITNEALVNVDYCL
jgi:hypothetical protein